MKAVKQISINKLIYKEYPNFKEGKGISNCSLFKNIPKEDLIEVEVTQEEWDKDYELSYVEKRKREYPSQFDYLDAKVKQESFIEQIREEGINQEQEYINKCLAVKAKHPKG